jgi:hypothetical protein
MPAVAVIPDILSLLLERASTSPSASGICGRGPAGAEEGTEVEAAVLSSFIPCAALASTSILLHRE